MNYRNLIVWQKSMDLVIEIYELSTQLEIAKRLGYIQQLPSKIIEIDKMLKSLLKSLK